MEEEKKIALPTRSLRDLRTRGRTFPRQVAAITKGQRVFGEETYLLRDVLRQHYSVRLIVEASPFTAAARRLYWKEETEDNNSNGRPSHLTFSLADRYVLGGGGRFAHGRAIGSTR